MSESRETLTWLRSAARTVALVTCCAASAMLLLAALLFAWTSVNLLLGNTPQPPGHPLRWQVPAIGFFFAAGFGLISAALSYYAISRWWPRR